MTLNAIPSSEDADSYADVATFKAYCEKIGHDIALLADEDIEQALRRGTAYLDGVYGARFIGAVSSPLQALEWPRKDARYRGGVLPDDVVPAKIANATIEAAFMTALQPDALIAGFSAAEQITREKVDVLEVQYSDNPSLTLEDATPTYSVIEGLLVGLLTSDGKGGIQFGTVMRG